MLRTKPNFGSQIIGKEKKKVQNFQKQGRENMAPAETYKMRQNKKFLSRRQKVKGTWSFIEQEGGMRSLRSQPSMRQDVSFFCFQREKHQ